mmetsp:Transcript_71115/g.199863  ORF Transcript_71115/g.199863 Transcript_71115/m.199863 type:complete len:444 (-) Transcript_71115:599-1930(-)
MSAVFHDVAETKQLIMEPAGARTTELETKASTPPTATHTPMHHQLSGQSAKPHPPPTYAAYPATHTPDGPTARGPSAKRTLKDRMATALCCQQPPDDDPNRSGGASLRNLGDFNLGRQLGEGASASVYEGLDTEFGVRVALKLVGISSKSASNALLTPIAVRTKRSLHPSPPSPPPPPPLPPSTPHYSHGHRGFTDTGTGPLLPTRLTTPPFHHPPRRVSHRPPTQTSRCFQARSSAATAYANEKSALEAVAHPHVLSLLSHSDREQHKGRRASLLVLERCPNGEIYHVMEKLGALDELVARTYAHQLWDALAACHDQLVFHRDIKPENLLLAEDWSLRVADFGTQQRNATQRVAAERAAAQRVAAERAAAKCAAARRARPAPFRPASFRPTPRPTTRPICRWTFEGSRSTHSPAADTYPRARDGWAGRADDQHLRYQRLHGS